MFTLQIIISFVVGGLVIALQTLIAERVPQRWRGIVLTIPTTMALGFFFVGLTKTPADVAEVALFFPAALVGSYIFVFFFALLSMFNFTLSFVVSYLVWALWGYISMLFPPENFYNYTFILTLPIIIAMYWYIKKMPQHNNFKPVPMNTKHIIVRSMLCGSVIVLVVILSKTLGNFWGSLFSAFPAAFSSTFVIYYLVHGKKIIPGVAQSLFFPGVIGFLLYALVAGLTFENYGIWYGTLFSYIIVFLFYWLYFVSHEKWLEQIKN